MKIVIEGAGQVGSHLAKMLSREANEITVIDSDAKRLSQLTQIADVVAVQGMPSSIKVMRSAGVPGCDLFIAVNPFVQQDVNVVSALLAKKIGAKKVTARLEDEEYLTPENKLLFKEMGLDLMFFPEKIAAEEIADQLKHSAATDSMDFAHGKLQMAVFKVEETSPMIDMKLGDFVSQTSADGLQFRIIAIARGEETLIPKVDTYFRYHDLVFTIAKREGMPLLMKYFGKSNIEVDRIMILGGSEIAEQLAKSFAKQVSEIKIIEKDKDRCLELIEMLPSNVSVVHGDGRNSDLLAEEDIRSYDAFAAVCGSDETNVLACVAAKKFGVGRVIAQVENVEYLRLAEELGVDTVINKKLLTAARMLKFTLSGKARMVKYMSGTKAEVLEYTVAPGSAITKCALKDMGFPRNAIVGGVIRGSESFIAVGDTVIEPYDRVAVFALPEAVKDVDRFFK
jgi:trk system potassium uptake protein TrkA